jgi:3'-5' exoribonuclease
VVRERQLRQKKNGEDFLKLQLGDRSGAVAAIAWDRISELFEACSPGAIVMVTGKFSVHPQFGRQIKLPRLAPPKPMSTSRGPGRDP